MKSRPVAQRSGGFRCVNAPTEGIVVPVARMERSVIRDSCVRSLALPATIPCVVRPGKHPRTGQLSATKIFHFTEFRICRTNETPRPCKKGRIAIVTNRGLGCDGRDGVGREERCRAGIPQGCSVSKGFRVNDTALTASSHGLDGEHTPALEDPAETCADGEVVWSWRPKLASSRAEALHTNRCETPQNIRAARVAIEPVSPGRARRKP
jgi:hypothetical protein